MNRKRSRNITTSTNVRELPPTKRAKKRVVTAPPSVLTIGDAKLYTEEFVFWWKERNSNSSYVTVNRNGELQVMNDEFPSTCYTPNLFELKKGSQGGRYIIYSHGLVSQPSLTPYALTVEPDTVEGYVLYFSNYELQPINKYEWCFAADNSNMKSGRYSIRWCEDQNIALRFDGDRLSVSGDGELFLSTFDKAT